MILRRAILSLIGVAGIFTLSACGTSPPAATTTSSPVATVATAPPAIGTTTTQVAPTTTTPIAVARPILGSITAIGDSVMVDYARALSTDLADTTVDAVVGQQWSAGIAEVEKLKSEGTLGDTVIVGLGTNGPITSSSFMQMMTALSGAQHVFFVNVHVDRPWQTTVNETLQKGVLGFPNASVIDWNGLATAHPSWFYSDGTHLPENGPGAKALAHLIATSVEKTEG